MNFDKIQGSNIGGDYDNTALNNSYPNIDQEFANLPDVDELIEQSELNQENDYEHYQ